MRPTLLTSCLALILTVSGCDTDPENEQEMSNKPIFSGRVEYVYYSDDHGAKRGYTRFEKGLPGTSTTVQEDVWVDVYPNWVVIKLLNRSNYTEIIPQQKMVSIIVGTEEGNALNVPGVATPHQQ